MSEKILLPKISYMALGELQKWPRNPKKHVTKDIVDSIERFGFVQPLVIDERSQRLVAGHGRLEALQQIKSNGGTPPLRINAEDNDWYVHGLP